jgi:DNA-directed RNA polymerase subunit beta'
MAMTAGQLLINDTIPDKYKLKAGSSTKEIQKMFDTWATNDPTSYATSITGVKRIADQVTMYEGFSPGIDDINPMKKERATLFKKYMPMFNKAKTTEEKKTIVADAMREGSKLVMNGSGAMHEMVRTGAKGNATQLMKNVLSPISAREPDNTPYPYMTDRSFAEGLSAGGYFVDSIEARNATVAGKTQVSVPGDFGKQLFNALNDMVVTLEDCGTDNGIALQITDTNVLDRYLAKSIPGLAPRNSLVTSMLTSSLSKKNIKELIVRSSMTCEARNGVCQKCYGKMSNGILPEIGKNVGTIAAQSLSEPLTQMTLSTKHGVMLAGQKATDVGMEGVKKLLAKPKIFPDKATLAEVDGVISRIEPAPQGGTYLYINDIEHYVPTTNKLKEDIKKNARVSKGEPLSEGLIDPRELSMKKGMGTGRQYFVDAMYNAYNPLDSKSGERSGIPLDKRHLEVLAKRDFNHVVINESSDTYTKGDIVDYNRLKSIITKDSVKEETLDNAIGDYLAKEYFHYTVGTEVTKEVVTYLRTHGVQKVHVSTRKIQYTPYITNVRQVPLLKENFLGRLSHHEIKGTLIEAAQLGEKADIQGYDPIPAFIHGITFGEGEDGKY